MNLKPQLTSSATSLGFCLWYLSLLPPPADCGAEPPTRGGARRPSHRQPEPEPAQQKKMESHDQPRKFFESHLNASPSRQTGIEAITNVFFFLCAPFSGIDGSFAPHRTSAERQSQFLFPFLDLSSILLF